jgi:hypothetical protein
MLSSGASLLYLVAMVGRAVVNGYVSNLGILLFSPLHTFFKIVLFCFGVLTVVLEQQRAVFSPIVRVFIETDVKFLTFITGRGAFYIYVGAIQASVFWKTNRFER